MPFRTEEIELANVFAGFHCWRKLWLSNSTPHTSCLNYMSRKMNYITFIRHITNQTHSVYFRPLKRAN